MKKMKFMRFGAVAAFAAVSVMLPGYSVAASIDDVIVRQQWPWSTDVKVEYKLSGVDRPVDIAVKAYNGDTEVDSAKLLEAISGDLYGVAESGVWSFLIDPVKIFGKDRVALSDFRVELEISPSADNINEVLYKIVSLDSQCVTNVTRKDLFNRKWGAYETSYTALNENFTTEMTDVLIWTGVTNYPQFKTDQMVFRKIPAGGKSYKFQEGSAAVNNGEGLDVSFARDFYIGVFEVTQAQAKKFMPNWAFYQTNELYCATRPADNASWYNYLRGGNKTTGGALWPEGDHTNVNSDRLISNMQNVTGLLIDLPTEQMWEFACRAGVTGEVWVTGQPLGTISELPKVCVLNNVNNGGGGEGNQNADLMCGPRPVGTYLPNAYGLYDMQGNITEACLNAWTENDDLDLQENDGLTWGMDPRGTAHNGGNYPARTMRGGNWYNAYSSGSYRIGGVNSRSLMNGYYGWSYFGARLVIYLDKNEDGTK